MYVEFVVPVSVQFLLSCVDTISYMPSPSLSVPSVPSSLSVSLYVLSTTCAYGINAVVNDVSTGDENVTMPFVVSTAEIVRYTPPILMSPPFLI